MNTVIGYLVEPSYFHIWGISGTTVILVCCMIASLFYKGRDGERYSPLNHFISELGEKGISRLAAIFNVGLIVGGLLNAVFMIQLGRYIGTVPALLFSVIGVIGSLACVSVGIFPLNNFNRHMIAAAAFFYGGMMTVIVFGIVSLLDKTWLIPDAFGAFAITVAAIFIAFITIMRYAVKKGVNFNMANVKRPSFWIYPLLEWVVMLSVTVWILAISIYVVSSGI